MKTDVWKQFQSSPGAFQWIWLATQTSCMTTNSRRIFKLLSLDWPIITLVIDLFDTTLMLKPDFIEAFLSEAIWTNAVVLVVYYYSTWWPFFDRIDRVIQLFFKQTNKNENWKTKKKSNDWHCIIAIGIGALGLGLGNRNCEQRTRAPLINRRWVHFCIKNQQMEKNREKERERERERKRDFLIENRTADKRSPFTQRAENSGGCPESRPAAHLSIPTSTR